MTDLDMGLRSLKSGVRYATNFCAASESFVRNFDRNISIRDASRARAHLAAVERQLGSIDPRFEAAGLKQPPQFYLDQARLGFGLLSRSLFAPLEGLLLAGLDGHPLPKPVDEALNADDDEYITARGFLAKLEPFMFRPMVGRGFIDSPNSRLLVLVTILFLRHMERSETEFTIAGMVAKITSLAGFDQLAKRFVSGSGAPGRRKLPGASEQDGQLRHESTMSGITNARQKRG